MVEYRAVIKTVPGCLGGIPNTLYKSVCTQSGAASWGWPARAHLSREEAVWKASLDVAQLWGQSGKFKKS